MKEPEDTKRHALGGLKNFELLIDRSTGLSIQKPVFS